MGAIYDKYLGKLRDDAGNGSGGAGEFLPKNSAWTTTVGGYTLSFDGTDGLTVSHDAGGVETLYANFASGRIVLSAATAGDDNQQFIIDPSNGVTANGSALTQETSEFVGTSLGIAELSGGVKYVCQSALTALSVGSAAPGCNATILFTLANGAVVTPPDNVPLFGASAYTPGSRYVMAVNGDMAVVAEAVEA